MDIIERDVEAIKNSKFLVYMDMSEFEEFSVNPVAVKDGIVSCKTVDDSLKEFHANRIVKGLKEKISNLKIEINDVDDNVYQWLKKAGDLFHEEVKGKVASLLDYFEPDTENSDSTKFILRLKKPLDKLSTEDIKIIKKLLKETFDINF